jgi:TRAP-type C4-dicarboxylate transport system permease large subunit
VLSSLTKVPIGEIVSAIWPFLASLVAALLLMVLVPETVTWLPWAFGFR